MPPNRAHTLLLSSLPRRSQTAVSQTAQRPANVGTGELVFRLEDTVQQRVEQLSGSAPRRVRGHLAVEHRGRNVRIEGGHLSPSLRAVVGGQAHQADVGVVKVSRRIIFMRISSGNR